MKTILVLSFSFYIKRKFMVDKITIAQILKPQGIRGEIKVKCLLDTPLDIKKYKDIEIDENNYQILAARTDLHLTGVYDRDSAERLRGKYIKVTRENAPPLEEGVYYIVDILGSDLYTENGENIGKIIDIYTASTDVYVIEQDKKRFSFPKVDGLILNIDIVDKKVTVRADRLKEIMLVE